MSRSSMRRHRNVVVCLALLASACDPLPPLPEDVRQDRFAAVLDELVPLIHDPGPPPPPGSDLDALAAWTRTTFSTWLRETRAQLVRGVRALPADPTPHERIVGEALRGLSYLTFARRILQTPTPREIAEDEELRAIYEDALRGAAAPLEREARAALSTCADGRARTTDQRALAWVARCEAELEEGR